MAPNIVEVEQRLGVNGSDFRLWVCLHEETHRVQFTAVPWLGPWLREQILSSLDGLTAEPGELGKRLQQVAGCGDRCAARDRRGQGARGSRCRRRTRELLGRLTAVMSLLEGHADVVMDAVGPDVIPTVDVLRLRMSERRANPKATEAFVRRLLGMESEAGAVPRRCRLRPGRGRRRRAWTASTRSGESPDHLPTRDELHAPEQWVARVATAS